MRTLSGLCLATCIAAAMTASADIEHHDVDCDVDFNHSLHISTNNIRVTDKDTLLYEIRDENRLWVGGEEVALEADQKQALADFSGNIRTQSKSFVTLAGQALDVAFSGITLAFAALDADNDELKEDMEGLRAKISAAMQEHFQQQGDDLVINQNGVEEIDSVFDEELETEIEEVVGKYAGSMAWGALKLAFSGGDDIEEELEERMEGLEAEVEAQAEVLEKSGLELCNGLRTLDEQEAALQQSIPALAPYDIVTVTAESESSEQVN